jgi:hypothetical protein
MLRVFGNEPIGDILKNRIEPIQWKVKECENLNFVTSASE